MIHIIKGSIFDSNCEALVNPTNCVGVWGKGLALEFKKRFPECWENHGIACEAGYINPGKVWVCSHLVDMPKHVICFPTKLDWRNPSKIEWIKDGLIHLKLVITAYKIKSIAIPALGCSNGGLNWEDVRPLIIEILSPLEDVLILVYEP